MIPLKRPIIFLDLETTGLILELDRIIEMSLLKIHPDGRQEEYLQRFDPGIKIPEESIAIHGITNEALKGQPRFFEKAGELMEFFGDCDLGGYAMHRLDIPMLIKEFERSGYVFSVEERRKVDSGVIFREKERRDLKTAYRLYCGKELVGAHGARADNLAAFEVFLSQLERYPDLPKDLDGLHQFCRALDPNHVDPEGKFVWRDGEAFFRFGKYKHRALAEIARMDSDYLDWIIQKADFSKEVVQICMQAKQGIFPHRKTPPPK